MSFVGRFARRLYDHGNHITDAVVFGPMGSVTALAMNKLVEGDPTGTLVYNIAAPAIGAGMVADGIRRKRPVNVVAGAAIYVAKIGLDVAHGVGTGDYTPLLIDGYPLAAGVTMAAERLARRLA